MAQQESAGESAVRVYFLDSRYKTILCAPTATTAKLFDDICNHIELQSRDLFTLWVSGNGLEFPLKSDEQPIEVLKKWDVIRNEYTYANDDDDRKKRLPVYDTPRLQLRLKGILDKHRQVKDAPAIMLLYVESMYCVVNSLYELAEEDAIYLAGLQCQITYGAFDPSTHKVGFLKNDVTAFVPKTLFPTKKPKQWEQLILAQYKSQKADQKDYILQLLYTARCKRFSNFGGKTFWGCRLGKMTKMYYEKNIPNSIRAKKVSISINQDGVYVFDQAAMVQLTFYPYHSIVSWDTEAACFLLEVQTGRYTSREFVFETPEAPLIDEVMSEQVDMERARQDDIENQIKEEKKRNQTLKEDRDAARKAQRDNRQANAMRTENAIEGENLFLPKND